MSNPKPVGVPSLALGLHTKDRASRIPPGAAQDGSKNFWLYRDVLATSPGYEKRTKALLDDFAYRLNGVDQYLRAQVPSAGTDLSAGHTATTIQFFFRLDAIPTDLLINIVGAESHYSGTVLYKGTGVNYLGSLPASSSPDYFFTISALASGSTINDGRPYITGFGSDGTTLSLTDPRGPIELGKCYAFTMVYEVGQDMRSYFGEVGGAQVEAINTASQPANAMQDTDSDVFIGCMPTLDPETEDTFITRRFRGVVQEFRIWDKALTQQEVDDTTAGEIDDPSAETNLVSYYRLTGPASATYFLEASKGDGAPFATYPRSATWVSDSHPLGRNITGNPAIRLDGEYQAIKLRDAYKYRKFQPDEEGFYPWASHFAVSMRIYPQTLADRDTLFHYVHCPTDNVFTDHLLTTTTATGTFVPANEVTGNLLVETLDVGAGVLQFRAVVFHQQRIKNETLTLDGSGDVDHTLASLGVQPLSFRAKLTLTGGLTVIVVDDGAGAIVKKNGSGTLTTGTIDYATGDVDIDFTVAITAGTAKYITRNATSCVTAVAGGVSAGNEYTLTAATDFGASTGSVSIYIDDEAVVTQNCTAGATVPWTTNSPRGSARKYAAIFGRAISESRKSLSIPTDPDDVEVHYDFNRSFHGEIKQIALAVSEYDFDVKQLHDVVAAQLLGRESLTTYGVPFTSLYPMNEGQGETLEDVGGFGNSLPIVEDSDHVFAKSCGVTTQRRGIQGLFDHRYRTPTGEERKVVAVSGGSCYEVDPSTGAFTFLGDGFRNDDLARVNTMRFQDSTVLTATATNRPFQLWKDHVYRLSIDKPKWIIAWGLTDQGNPEAGLRRGARKYLFTHYSAWQNKRSDARIGPDVTIKFKRANVVFGEEAEINQTYPSFGPSLKKAPYDMSTPYTKIGMSGWYGQDTTLAGTDPSWYETNPSTSGANTNAAPLKRINFKKVPNSKDPEQMEAADLFRIVDLYTNRVFVEDIGNDLVEFRGAFPGSKGFLWLEDSTSGKPTVRDSSTAIIRYDGVVSSGTSVAGTGVTGHGISLPVSSDPQVTHLEIWRTLSGGNEYFLVDRIPNGTRTYVDRTDDADLVGETLDINAGMAPRCTHMVDFAGRAFAFGDALAPQRLYISEALEPWNFAPQNFVDLTDGTTLAITGVARTENVLLAFKNDTTFAIRATGNPAFPFDVETRMRDVGCVSPNGIVNVQNVFHYPDEQGFFQYDTNTLKHISDAIETTFNEIPAEHYDRIFGIHDREHNAVVWFYPSGNQTIGEQVVNDRALVYFYETGAWSLLDGLFVEFAAIIPDQNEVNRVWLVDPLGYASLWNLGTNYGVGTLTTRSVTISAWNSTTTFEVPQATLASLPEGYKGLPVVIETGGARYTRYVTGDDLAATSEVTINMPIAGPPVGGTAHFGSIETDWISGEFMPAGQDMAVGLTDVHLQLTPQSTSASFEMLWLARYGIHPSAVIEGSATLSNQRNELFLSARQFASASLWGRRHRFRFRSLGPDKPFEIRSMIAKMNSDVGPGEYRDDE